MLKILFLFLTLISSLSCAYCKVNEVKIIKVVNNHPITTYDIDLEERIIRYTVDFFQMNAFKEKLSCKLEKNNFSEFIPASIAENIILDSKISHLAPSFPSSTPILKTIESITKDQNISQEQFKQSLKKADITLDQLAAFFSSALQRSRIVRHICETECTGLTRNEILRLATMGGCFTDLKLEYLYLSEPANQKGLTSLIKTRVNLEKGHLPPNKKTTTVFLTEIVDKEIGTNLVFLEEGTTSKIWKSDNTWKMLYLHKSTMIDPQLDPIAPYDRMTTSLKMQGTLKKIFDQLESSSFSRDIN
jgi:hypothetical protein